MQHPLLAWVALSSALVAGLSTASAQEGGGKKKDQDQPEFDRPGGRKATTSEPKVATPEAALEKALPVMTTWPAEAGEIALAALAARGPEVVPLLRARLKNGTVLERSAAARGLCLLADAESFVEIEKLFADPRQRARYGALLSSLHDLDPARAAAVALRFLESEQAPLRNAARALLKQHPSAQSREQLKASLLAARSDGARLDLFELLAELKEPTLPTLALERFLGAKDPALASATTELLSWQDAPEIVGELVRLAGAGRERRNLHAALALALHEQRTSTALLPEALFDQYLPMVRTSDLLLRATACIVCGMVGYRSEAHEEEAKAQVVPALADVVIHGRFFGDFELCFATSVSTLELLTGERFGKSIPAWRDWFAKNPDARYSGKRELQGFVLDQDQEEALVMATRADAKGEAQVDLALCGERHRGLVASGSRPGALAISLEPMRELLLDLERQGLFGGELPRQLAPAQAGDLVVRVTTRGRERAIALRADDRRAATIEAALTKAVGASWWQLLLAFDETYPRRFAEEQAWFTTHPEVAAQRSRLVDLALAQFASADAGAARQAFDVLARLDDLGACVRATQIDALAAQLTKLPWGDPRTQQMLELLIATKRDDAFDRIVEALTPRGLSAVDALGHAIVKMDRGERAVADARPLVRLAALSLAERGALAVPEPSLLSLAANDGEERVRTKALALLAKGGGEAGMALLLQQAEQAPITVRAEALRLLGWSKRDDALQCLIATTRGSDPSLAAAALEGLARRADEGAAAAIAALVRESGPGEALGRLALAALKGMPRAIAVGRLRQLMAESTGSVAREAAYGLADLGEMDSVPTLLADLEDEKLHRRALTLLTYLFCKDPGTETWRFRSIHEASPGSSHVDHFLSALKEGGALVPEGNQVRDGAFHPLFVAAIEDSRWFVRRSALEQLEAVYGRSLGTLSMVATPEEIRALADRWREVLQVQAGGGDR